MGARRNVIITDHSGLGTGTKKGASRRGETPRKFDMLKMADSPRESKKARVLNEVAGHRETTEERRAAEWLTDQVRQAREGGVHAMVAELSPALARVLLNLNQHNRRLSKVVVSKYARDIVNGNWTLNGQTVVISRDGELNDGQHRCHAVVDAGQSVPVVFVFGTDRESRFTLDQGKSRMAGDYLGMHGYSDPLALASAAKYVWQHREIGRLSNQTLHSPTKTEVQAIVEQHADIADSLAAIPRKGCDSVGGRSLLAFCHWTFTKRASGAAASGFMKSFVEGVNLGPRDPILYARNRLMAERGRMSPNEKAELIIRAWNAHRRGETPRTMAVLNGALPIVER